MIKKSHTSPLHKLGLTKLEVQCYELLINKDAQNAKELASTIGILPNAVYRLTNELKHKGFVTCIGKYPTTFHAVPRSIAILSRIQNQQKKLRELEDQILQSHSLRSSSNESATRLEFIKSRSQMYNTFVEMAKQAEKEILVISIGEPVSDEVKLAHRDALERGVSQKLLFHKHDKGNEDILRSWVKMGIEVRYYPVWGFHLIIFDGKRSMLVANNPKATEERTGIVIYSEGLSKALKDYFYSVWTKAKVI